MRLILGSASPARLATLRAAGLDPEVIVSGVDESATTADSPVELALALATRKGDAVAERVSARPAVVVGCDSVLEFDGCAYGRPPTVAAARQRWLRMRGKWGLLHTGHRVIVLGDSHATASVVATTRVRFGELSDAEIDAYLATGEPLQVAGAFTIDGLGGPFIDAIDGDPHNVVGISLPLLRQTLAKMGVTWPQLWPAPPTR